MENTACISALIRFGNSNWMINGKAAVLAVLVAFSALLSMIITGSEWHGKVHQCREKIHEAIRKSQAVRFAVKGFSEAVECLLLILIRTNEPNVFSKTAMHFAVNRGVVKMLPIAGTI